MGKAETRKKKTVDMLKQLTETIFFQLSNSGKDKNKSSHAFLGTGEYIEGSKQKICNTYK